LSSFIIHAHFYQPPREDPFTRIVPVEIGAAPYQNWNERIFSECYQPNAEQGNFEKISFNIGPTLFSWIQNSHPDTAKKIISQDQMNVKRHGVGNAMAQSYYHMILPFSSRRDKITQIKWGCADFRHRFRRQPKGLWLPETAVDMETLEILVEHGIDFTILAPWQSLGPVQPNKPYKVRINNNRDLVVFFFNKELSSTISFDPKATVNADSFAEEKILPLIRNFRIPTNHHDQVIFIATDGELYGHHQIFRNFFLERLVDGALSRFPINLTYPEKWLNENRVNEYVLIKEDTSWSCHHGIDRWLGLCDCNQGNMEWKTQLWKAFANLSIELDDLYHDEVVRYVGDPWLLRDHYIHVITGELTFDELLGEFTSRAIKDHDVIKIQKLLDSQLERMRMFTSCGWFFNQFNRIETLNNLAYAAQAVVLTYKATGVDLSPAVIHDLIEFEYSDSDQNVVDQFCKQLQRAQINTEMNFECCG
jgi:alpha-amylase/alpha-mannosidase (GH57 family)